MIKIFFIFFRRTSFITFFLLSVISFPSFSQPLKGTIGFLIPQDKVILKNGDTETGKVIRHDSVKILLRKYDYSEKNILRDEIDTITGLSYYTYFGSFSLGTVYWKSLVTQRLDTISPGGVNLDLKFGAMRKKKLARHLGMNYQAGDKLKILRLGVGIRRYFLSDYTQKNNFYLGFNFGYNIPSTNMNRFMDFGWCMGFEHLFGRQLRFFMELNRLRTLKYEPNPTMLALNVGTRFSREYNNYYRKLNQD